MRTTVTIEDELIEKAREYAPGKKTSELLKIALRRFIESEASRWLANAGGTCPDLEAPPRRRFPA